MPTYSVSVDFDAVYIEVEAKSEEEAVELVEAMPVDKVVSRIGNYDIGNDIFDIEKSEKLWEQVEHVEPPL